MKIATVAFLGFVILMQCPLCVSQASSALTPEERAEADRLHHSFHPKLAMQDALSRAEKYMANENIDARSFWLYRAQFIALGDTKTSDKDRIPGWHFWWVSDSGEMGNYIEIFVTMDGQCSRLPSM